MNYEKEIHDLKINVSDLENTVDYLKKIIMEKDEKICDLISTLNQILITLDKPKKKRFKFF
jgi:predicted RNase H-like nuclease (RuvC/YqgF family)